MDIKISYTSSKAIGRLLNRKDKNSRSLSVQRCLQAVYIDKTGKSFSIRFKEHLQTFITNTGKSKFAEHAVEQGHPFAQIIEILSVIAKVPKCSHMEPVEKYSIYKAAKLVTQNNDQHTLSNNPVFEDLTSRACSESNRQSES